MQNQKKKHYTAEFKAKVVIEILKEEKTVSQLSAEYGIHTSQLYKEGNPLTLNDEYENIDEIFHS